jgi:hypothetical protein
MTVALGIQHEERMCWIVICGPPGSTVFFHIISQRERFSEKKVLNTKSVFLFSLQILLGTFLILKKIQRGIIINA